MNQYRDRFGRREQTGGGVIETMNQVVSRGRAVLDVGPGKNIQGLRQKSWKEQCCEQGLKSKPTYLNSV